MRQIKRNEYIKSNFTAPKPCTPDAPKRRKNKLEKKKEGRRRKRREVGEKCVFCTDQG